MSPRIIFLLLLAFCALLFFPGLSGDLYRTEGLRARIAAECFESGNWIVPTLYGQPLFTKPPGMYVAIGLASEPFGAVTDWSARLPSALAATMLVFLFYWYFGRQFGPLGGLVAALLLPLSPMWLDRVPSAEIDVLQVAWVGAALLFFLRALEAEDRTNDELRAMNDEPVTAWIIGHRSSLPWWFLSLLCVAGGFLTKWTAPAFFYLTVVPLLVWRGEWRLLLGRGHVLAMLAAAGVCISWIVAAGMSAGWDVLYQTVSAEALQHLSPAHRHEPYPWLETLTFPFRILAANLPVAAFSLLTLRRGFTGGLSANQRRTWQAMHCWVWPNLIFWSVIPGHAVRHSFPLSPGLAGLAALTWIGWLSPLSPLVASRSLPQPNDAPPRQAAWGLFTALMLGWLVVKVAHVEYVLPPRSMERQPRAKGELLATAVPPGEALFLVQVKDEGIMFYYGRPVRRLANFGRLPSTGEPVYCILTAAEWRGWPSSRPAKVMQRLTDQQGDPLVLVKVATDDPLLRASGCAGPQGQ